MKIKYDNCFDYFPKDEKSRVFEIFQNEYKDDRGSFMEVVKDYGEWPHHDIPLWFSNIDWVKQINRSYSKRLVIRGCHAQKGMFCQGKLVEALNEVIYDIITDARPNSSTFGVSRVFKLNPMTKNQLWVPRGFLHCVVYPKNTKNAILQYFCDNTYNKESETGVNPKTIIPKVVKEFKKLIKDDKYTCNSFKNLFSMFEEDEIVYSDKDTKADSYSKFMKSVKKDYDENGKLWYC